MPMPMDSAPRQDVELERMAAPDLVSHLVECAVTMGQMLQCNEMGIASREFRAAQKYLDYVQAKVVTRLGG